MQPATLEIIPKTGDAIALSVKLYDTGFASVVLEALAERQEASQARRSGEAICVGLQNFPTDILTHEGIIRTDEFTPGELFVHCGDPTELGIAYGQVRYRANNGKDDCYLVGLVETKDLEKLTMIGNLIHSTGFGEARLVVPKE